MFKINLDIKPNLPVYMESDGDIEAFEEMCNAENDLRSHELKQALVTSAIEYLSHGLEFSKDLVDNSRDEELGLEITKSTLKSTSKLLGQNADIDKIADSIKNYEVGVEASDNVLKKLLAKTKELIKKAWDFLVNLAKKVVVFLKNFIGTKDTATKIKKEYDEAKAKGFKKPSEVKFSVLEAENAIQPLSLLMRLKDTDGINASDIEKIVIDSAERVAEFNGGEEFIKPLNNFQKVESNFLKNIDENATLRDIFKLLDYEKELLKVPLKKGIYFLDKLPEKLKEIIIESSQAHIAGGLGRIIFKVVYNDGGGVGLLSTSDLGGAVITEQDLDNIKGTKAFIYAEHYFKSLDVSFYYGTPMFKSLQEDAKLISKYAKYIKPIPLDKINSIRKDLEQLVEQTKKNSQILQSKIEKADEKVKNMLAILDEKSKIYEKNAFSDVNLPKHINGLKIEYCKYLESRAGAGLKAELKFLKALVKPPYEKYILESLKLYEK